MIITITEIVYIVITTFVVGYIFSGMFKHEYKLNKDAIFDRYKIFDWESVKWGVIVAAPGIILHEMAHKFTALSFGLTAYYQIWPTGLFIGVVLRALNSGLILLAPGYVTIAGATQMQSAIIAFAGPFINLVLWIGSYLILKHKKGLTGKWLVILAATQQINKWLFIFNMIPIPPLDGSKVFAPLFNLLGF